VQRDGVKMLVERILSCQKIHKKFQIPQRWKLQSFVITNICKPILIEFRENEIRFFSRQNRTSRASSAAASTRTSATSCATSRPAAASTGPCRPRSTPTSDSFLAAARPQPGVAFRNRLFAHTFWVKFSS
jgi:hypothetical protein